MHVCVCVCVCVCVEGVRTREEDEVKTLRPPGCHLSLLQHSFPTTMSCPSLPPSPLCLHLCPNPSCRPFSIYPLISAIILFYIPLSPSLHLFYPLISLFYLASQLLSVLFSYRPPLSLPFPPPKKAEHTRLQNDYSFQSIINVLRIIGGFIIFVGRNSTNSYIRLLKKRKKIKA